MAIKVNRRMMSAIFLVGISCGLVVTAQVSAVQELLAEYGREGAGKYNAVNGEKLWKRVQVDAKTGQKRSCVTCHTNDLRKPGKHARTGKLIKPMAPSVNADRLTDKKKIEKWFHRNCKWTLGRICTPQEKADILAYLANQ
ncbi:DUF1924 domain-containing protein [Thiolapillus sp.]